MVSSAISSWTLTGLVRSFLDLTLAYFLLCGSTLGYFPWKFCHVFGIHLPCPCSGFFGYKNDNLCWHKLFIQWPRRKINSVQNLALSRFPFNSVSINEESNSNDVKFGIGVIGLEGEACSTSLSGLKLQTMVDEDGGFDANGRRTMNPKPKWGTRRRKRTAFGNGKSNPVLLSGNFPLPAVAGVSCSYIIGGETRPEIKDNFGPVSEIEDSFPDDKNTRTGTDIGETIWHGFELSSGEEKCSTFMEKFISNDTNEKTGFIGDEADLIRMLEQALEEEKTRLAAIYLELEKERAAASSAADEAMAMIMRLQEDKASIEMEARQYKRMMEEKFAYDDEEMDILKEILVRREKENHLLERKLEACRETNYLLEEPEEYDFSYNSSNGGQQPSIPLGPDEDPQLMVKQAGKIGPGVVGHDGMAGHAIATKTVQGIDVEPAIYDVHVVDDKVDVPKEDGTKESNEMLAIGAEIEGLRERLRIVREEKVKLTFSSDQRKRVDAHLKLIEELVNQLREFQQLKEPVRHASLPPLSSSSSSKAGSNRRRCRSVSDETEDSA